MPIAVEKLVSSLTPERTVLLFGAGSSLPSGAPSVARLQAHFERTFGVEADGYSLAEQAAIIEQSTQDRSRLIGALRSQFKGLAPAGALLNLPLYNWKSIYTTNYDDLVEKCYQRRDRPLSVYSSNFDFGVRSEPDAVQFFKLHGTITKDISDGIQSRIILTEGDYDQTEEYREHLYDRLKSDLAGAELIIIGHSLADPDIRSIVNRALTINAKAGAGGRIALFSYTRDEGRATLLEARGIRVVFGSIDDFFAALSARIVASTSASIASGDPLDTISMLRPATLDAVHACGVQVAEVSSMYNGWPATYADIAAGLTFRRNIADDIYKQLLASDKFVGVLLGASGVGKTTAARQVLSSFIQQGAFAWEHKLDQALVALRWRDVGRHLNKHNQTGILLIDEAHADLPEVNDLIDFLASDNHGALKLLLVSPSHQWRPRVKSAAIYRRGVEHHLSRVQGDEIDRLLVLVETSDSLRPLIEQTFSGFSRAERRRRLVNKCEADMFVCLKNIFSSDKFDDIILREYACLDVGTQEVYRAIAAMESAGVHVHRQLVIRLLNIPAMDVGAVLTRLTDIVHEQVVNEREGIYAWRGRHRVIMSIIAEHKYFDVSRRLDLFSAVIEAISPTYDIEIRTLRELCSSDNGIAKLPERSDQNVLLRKMMSVAPGERVPRHRLIRNLIELGEFDKADTEIRIFETDFGLDGPAVRYRINLATARAVRSPGLLNEDRVVLIEKARVIAAAAAGRYRMNKAILIAYCEVGIEAAKLTGGAAIFETAISELKTAEDRIGDPDISRRVAQLERRMSALDLEDERSFAISLAED